MEDEAGDCPRSRKKEKDEVARWGGRGQRVKDGGGVTGDGGRTLRSRGMKEREL